MAPDLKGAGLRSTEDSCGCGSSMEAVNPDTIMPPYYRVDGPDRVAPAFAASRS
jgi:hypothetical protein